MKRLTEGKAAVAAIAVSLTTLAGTFGLASSMRQFFRTSNSGSRVAMTTQTPIASSDPKVEAGRHLFRMNCAHCHGDDARGEEGPDLYNLRKTDERIHRVITAGIKGEMPSFGKKLNDADVQALTTYLRSLHS
jgi:mono/diheme cytochrome c family protein